MFIILTIITLWGLLIFRWSAINQPFPAGGLLALRAALLSPLTIGICSLWLLCIFIRLAMLIVAGRMSRVIGVDRFRRARASERKFIYWMNTLDIPLLVSGLILLTIAGFSRQMAPLVIGIILTVGLLLHAGEQWLRSYLS